MSTLHWFSLSNNILLYACTTFYLSVVRHLGCTYFLTTMDNSDKAFTYNVLMRTYFSFLVGLQLEADMLNYVVTLSLSSGATLCSVAVSFDSLCCVVCLLWCLRVLPHISLSRPSLPVSTECRFEVSICTGFMASYMFFMHSNIIYIISLEKYVFKS